MKREERSRGNMGEGKKKCHSRGDKPRPGPECNDQSS